MLINSLVSFEIWTLKQTWLPWSWNIVDINCRLVSNGILSSSVETLAPMKGFTAMGTTTIPLRQPPEVADHSQWTTLCPPCMQNYEREVANLVTEESEKPSSKPEAHQALPQWLQLAKLSNGDTANSTSDCLQVRILLSSSANPILKWNYVCIWSWFFCTVVVLFCSRRNKSPCGSRVQKSCWRIGVTHAPASTPNSNRCSSALKGP